MNLTPFTLCRWVRATLATTSWLTIEQESSITIPMIGQLTGILVDDVASDTILLNVHGVGYELTIPDGTLGRIRSDGAGDTVTLHVHTHVREDTFVLYGFSSLTERRAFRSLLGISGIGPRLALGILSVLPSWELAKAIQSRDVRALTSVPGIGKKSAERILLELKDKLTFALASDPVSPQESSTVMGTSGPVGQQVVEGLTRMGFKPSEAQWAISSLGDSVENRAIQDVFREALALLRH